MKIVVIGAAPTALGAAYRLHELQREGCKEASDVELLCLEREKEAGGLSCSVRDEKGFLWDMGGHITFHHNQPYYEKAVKWAVDDWNDLTRNCQVDMNYVFGEQGIHLVPYPAQFAVPLFPADMKQACLRDLNVRYNQSSSLAASADFEEWVNHHFGPTILENFFRPYTKKVWTVDVRKMSSDWVGTRVAKLPQQKLEELCAMTEEELKSADDFGWGPNAVFSFPRYGGTGAVWTSMAGKLPSQWFSYNSSVTEVLPSTKKVRYTNEAGEEKESTYDVLLNTAPIDELVKQTQITAPLNIEHNKVFIIGVGLRRPAEAWVERHTWLYFPDPAVPFYRVTVLSRYGEVTPDASKYWSVMCECARPIDDPATEDEIRQAAIDGLVLKSIIQRDQIESVFSCTLPYGYPIPTVARDSELARAHRVLEQNSIYSRGRFGGWKYEASNQDHCFIQGKEFVDRILFGTEETMYKTGLTTLKRG